MNIALFGESASDYNTRVILVARTASEADYRAVKVKNETVADVGLGVTNPVATPKTPMQNLETAYKLASVPPTPSMPTREIDIDSLPGGDLSRVWGVENPAKLKTVVTEQRLLDKVRELIPSGVDGKLARKNIALIAEEAEAFKDVVSANSPSGSEGSGQATPVQQSGDVRSASPTVVGSPAPVEASSNLRDAADMLPDEVVTEKRHRSRAVVAGHSYAEAAQASTSQHVSASSSQIAQSQATVPLFGNSKLHTYYCQALNRTMLQPSSLNHEQIILYWNELVKENYDPRTVHRQLFANIKT